MNTLLLVATMWNEERDRAARLAKMAIDAGVAAKQVRLAEKLSMAMRKSGTAAMKAPEPWPRNSRDTATKTPGHG